MVKQLAFAHKQVKTIEWNAREWGKCYEMSMVDYKKSIENSTAQYVALQWKVTSLKLKCSILN
jgi:hypothetical protein